MNLPIRAIGYLIAAAIICLESTYAEPHALDTNRIGYAIAMIFSMVGTIELFVSLSKTRK